MSFLSASSSPNTTVNYHNNTAQTRSDLVSKPQASQRVLPLSLLTLAVFQKKHFPNISEEMQLVPLQVAKILNVPLKTRVQTICKCLENVPNLLCIALNALALERRALETDLKESEAFHLLENNGKQILNCKVVSKSTAPIVRYESETCKPKTFVELTFDSTDGFAFYLRYFKNQNYLTAKSPILSEKSTDLSPLESWTVSAEEQDIPQLQEFMKHGNQEVKNLARSILLLIENKKYSSNFDSCVNKSQLCLIEMANLFFIEKFKDIAHMIAPGLTYLAMLRLKSAENAQKEDCSKQVDHEITKISDQVDRVVLKSKIQIELYQELYKILANLAPTSGAKRTAFFKQHMFTVLKPEEFAKVCGNAIEKVKKESSAAATSKTAKKKKKLLTAPSLPTATGVDPSTNSMTTLAKPNSSTAMSSNAKERASKEMDDQNKDQKSELHPSAKLNVTTTPQIQTPSQLPPKATFPYQYALRVKRWFKLHPNAKIPFSGYADQDPIYSEKTRIRHAFSRAVDSLILNKAFVHRQTTLTQKGKREIFHLIAQFEYSEQAYDRGIISYAVVNNVCFHRFFSLYSTSSFMNRRLEDLFDESNPTEDEFDENYTQNDVEESSKENFEALKEHPQNSYVQIVDKFNNTKITIFKIH